MNDPFYLPVHFQGNDLAFPAQLFNLGAYTHKIKVSVYGIDILFERDEDGEYSAVVDSDSQKGVDKLDRELLKAVADAITRIQN